MSYCIAPQIRARVVSPVIQDGGSTMADSIVYDAQLMLTAVNFTMSSLSDAGPYVSGLYEVCSHILQLSHNQCSPSQYDRPGSNQDVSRDHQDNADDL